MSTRAAKKDVLSHDRFVGVERPLAEGVAGHKVRRTNLVGVGGEMQGVVKQSQIKVYLNLFIFFLCSLQERSFDSVPQTVRSGSPFAYSTVYLLGLSYLTVLGSPLHEYGSTTRVS